MAGKDKDRNQTPLHQEGGIPIIPGPAEREQAARNAEKIEEGKYKQEHTAIQRGILQTQRFLVIFGLIGAGIGIWQAFTAQKAADTAENSVLLAQRGLREQAREAAITQRNSLRALRASIEQFTIEERPVVFVDLKPAALQPNHPVQADILYDNYGKTPAVHGSVWGAIFTGDDALKQADRWFSLNPPQNRRPAEGMTIMPIPQSPQESPNRSTLLSKEIPTAQTLAHYAATDFAIVVAGRVSYYDFSGHWYYTDFCYSRFASNAVPACRKHNQIH